MYYLRVILRLWSSPLCFWKLRSCLYTSASISFSEAIWLERPIQTWCQRRLSFSWSGLRRGSTQTITGISPPSWPPTQQMHSWRTMWTRGRLHLGVQRSRKSRRYLYGDVWNHSCHQRSMLQSSRLFIYGVHFLFHIYMHGHNLPRGRQYTFHSWLYLVDEHIVITGVCTWTFAIFDRSHPAEAI